ncbi:MAG: HlyD family efflux transporter periplasmic adaptor subunit [Armatimonadetes bacterium]|jgi:HlyD family secretion protein|nr:HlyD family efflux transporter periplasmic adaptor subunit [Armatimonadota bacterium]
MSLKAENPKRSKLVRLVAPLLIVAIIAGIVIHSRMVSIHSTSPTVIASGTIEAIEMDISPRLAGQIVALRVDEGDRVKKGQVIALLDDSELHAQVGQARGALLTSQARLDDLLAGSRKEQIRQARAEYNKALTIAGGAKDLYDTTQESYQKSTELKVNLTNAESTFKAAEKERVAASARLTLVKQGPRKEEIENLKAQLDQAKAHRKNAESEYDRYSQLFKGGAISKQQLDNALAARDSARGMVDASDARHQQALTGSRPEEVQEAEARLAQADARLEGAKESLVAYKQIYADRLESRRQLETAKSNYQAAQSQSQAAKANLDLLITGATKDAIEAARGQVEQSKNALAAATTHLSYATIVAPADGVVSVKYRELGEFASPGVPIVKIASLDRVWLRVYAPLPTLGKVKVGQVALVRADTYHGKVYRGRVSSISEEPEFTPKSVQTTEERVKLVYSVRIDLDNAAQELKPGMPADAEIHLAGQSSAR